MRVFSVILVTFISFIFALAINQGSPPNLLGLFVYSLILVSVSCKWGLDTVGLPKWISFFKAMAILAGIQGMVIIFLQYVSAGGIKTGVTFMDFANTVAPYVFGGLIIQNILLGLLVVMLCKSKITLVSAEVVEEDED